VRGGRGSARRGLRGGLALRRQPAGGEVVLADERGVRLRRGQPQQPLGLLRRHPLLRLLGQQPGDDLGERPGVGGGERQLLGDGVRGLDGGGPAVGRAALDGLVERAAQRPHVGLRPGGGAADALGRQEVDGADELAGAGQGGGAGGLGDAEVGEHDPPGADLALGAAAEQDVAGFDVAVQHPGAVRGPQRGDHAAAYAGGFGGRQRAVLLEQFAEGDGLDVLHDDGRQALVVHHVVDDDDVGVADPGGGAGLAAGALEEGGQLVVVHVRLRRVQLLHRDEAVEQLVLGPPHRAHAAAADACEQPVAARDQPPFVARLHHVRLLRLSPVRVLCRDQTPRV
jgi:hypothetical protein